MPPKAANGVNATIGLSARREESPGSDSMPLAASISNGSQAIEAPPPFDFDASNALSPPNNNGVALPSGSTNGGGSWSAFGGISLPGHGASQHDSQAGSVSAISSNNFFSQSHGQASQSQATTLPAESQQPSQPPPKGKGGRKKKQQVEAQQQSQAANPPFQSAQMAIDPALLDGPFSAGASALPTPADAAIVPAASANAGLALQNAAAMDGDDVAVVKAEPKDEEEPFDVMTGAGIDLKAEQEAIAGPSRVGMAEAAAGARSSVRQAGADPTKGGLFMNVYDLSFRVHRIAFKHQLQVDPDVLNYLSLATRQRFRNLLETMVSTSRHRNWSNHTAEPGFWPDRKGKRRRMDDEEGNEGERIPLFRQEIISDPELQLSAIEKVDRHHDMRAKQRRKERDEKMQATLEAEARGEVVGDIAAEGEAAPLNAGISAAAKKSLTDPKHATAEVSKKLADSIANTAFGGGASKYSWMSSGVGGLGMGASRGLAGASAGSPPASGDTSMADGTAAPKALPKPRFAPPPASTSTAPGEAGSGSGWAAAANRIAAGSESSSTNAAWTDFASRQKEKEEEERLARVRVTLSDALAALERERAGGAGLGSGISVLYATQALGAPTGPFRPTR